MTRDGHPIDMEQLAEGLVAVATRLEPKEAAAVLIEAMYAIPHHEDALMRLVKALALVVVRLEPKEATATLTRVKSMIRTSYFTGSRQWVNVFTVEPSGLEEKDAKETATSLAQAMTKITDAETLAVRAHRLATMAGGLEPVEASAVCRTAAATLTQAMAKSTNEKVLFSLAERLAAVASRLEPKEASAWCRQAATILTQAMIKATDNRSFEPLAKGLAAVASRLEDEDAKQAATPLSQAMAKSTDALTLRWLAEGSAAVTVRLDPREGAALCRPAAAMLTQSMTLTSDEHVLMPLAEGLAAVASRLEPREAEELAAALIHAMITPDANPSALSEAVLVLVAKLPTRRGSLLQAGTLRALPESFFEWVEREVLDSRGRLRSIHSLSWETRHETYSADDDGLPVIPIFTRYYYTSILAELLGLEAPASRTRRCRSLAATVGLGATPTTLPAVPALAIPAAQALPEPPPDESLVTLLKHPFCVGKVRRLVLDALEVRHGRHFADQWEFVRYATEQKLPLDFTSPPQRPALPAAPAAGAGMPRN